MEIRDENGASYPMLVRLSPGSNTIKVRVTLGDASETYILSVLTPLRRLRRDRGLVRGPDRRSQRGGRRRLLRPRGRRGQVQRSLCFDI